MVQYTQTCPVLYGAGALSVIGQKAKELGMTKALIVHGKSVIANGTLARTEKYLDEVGIAHVDFGGIKSDAPDYVVNEGGQFAKDQGVDGVIALGGGSTLDAAKAIDILVTNPLPVSKWYANPMYVQPVPLICVPTTSGTGSESTLVGVIYDTENNYKNAVLRAATLAILDPELTVTAPASVTAGCGLDAFAHALEAYTSSIANPRSDVLALDAMAKIKKYLPLSVADGKDIEARSQLLLASNFAGIAFGDANVHVGHAIAHSFGVAFHMAHGEGCALTVPVVLRLAGKACPDRLVQIAKALGYGKDDAAGAEAYAVETMKALLKTVGIKSLKERGISLEAAVACAEYASKEWFVPACAPCPVTKEDMEAFITDIWNER